ncbi:MAG: EAL domain-containing protein [Alphaproteobacteria bacterium]|nr:EAL domain-containing protein [Alphaproteobacteria bacterium]
MTATIFQRPFAAGAPRALIADDDPTMRLLIRAALEDVGFLVEDVDDGSGVLARCADFRPDVVLLDVVMRELRGFETCVALRELPEGEHVPILMMTGLDDVQSINRAYDVGATDFIVKPINWGLLGHRVRYLLRTAHALARLRDHERRLAEAQRLARIGSWEWNRAAGTVQWSAEMYRILAIAPATEPSTSIWQARVHPEDAASRAAAWETTVADEAALAVDYRVVMSGGEARHLAEQIEPWRDAGGQVVGLRGATQDITERKRVEARLHHLAHHDTLTDLPNRVLFHQQLKDAIARARREKQMVAVHCVNLDHFKEVNDSLGHPIGDRLLRAVASRLATTVRETDRLAHLGGDEFAVVQTAIDGADSVDVLARRLIAAIAKPFTIDQHQLTVGATVGIAAYPGDGAEAHVLLKHADLALNQVKIGGRGSHRFFEEAMNAALQKRRWLEQELRQALAQDQFELHYQPQCHLESGERRGYEALIRWRHPTRGMVPPLDFIGIAEEIGLISAIGEWTLRQACRDAASWTQKVQVSVNLSPLQFKECDIVQVVADALAEAGLESRWLELEVTEGLLLHGTEQVLDTFRRLKALGVTIAMDDFGTGYSSLAYLCRFPFDKIKIDKSFVQSLGEDANIATIVGATIALGRALGMTVTAEGVETEAQADFLRAQGCHQVQGYLYGRPAPIHAPAPRAAALSTG